MPQQLMDLDYLLETENNVIEVTANAWGVGGETLTKIINLLFKLSHFINEDYEIESDDNSFQLIAYSTYLCLPYTLRSIHNEWFRGYYLESFILIRHIVEGFAKLRYFMDHRNLINQHFTAKKHRDRISFKKMFDTVAPNFYDLYYARILCGYSHGGLIAYFTRTEYSSQTDGRVIAGCEFNDKLSGLVINQTLTFCYGYLNYIDKFFPSIMDKLPSDLSKQFKDLLTNMFSMLNSPREKPSHQKEWEEVIRPFVE